LILFIVNTFTLLLLLGQVLCVCVILVSHIPTGTLRLGVGLPKQLMALLRVRAPGLTSSAAPVWTGVRSCGLKLIVDSNVTDDDDDWFTQHMYFTVKSVQNLCLFLSLSALFFLCRPPKSGYIRPKGSRQLLLHIRSENVLDCIIH
jgi:hypothetical protein